LRTDPRNRHAVGLPAGILAQALGLGGGSVTLDAACASSLVRAEAGLRRVAGGRLDAALAGGLNRADSLYTQMGFSQLRALSPTGGARRSTRPPTGCWSAKGHRLRAQSASPTR